MAKAGLSHDSDRGGLFAGRWLRRKYEVRRLGMVLVRPPGGMPGAVVHRLRRRRLAAAAGLRAGDRIVACDGKQVQSPATAAALVATLPAEKRIALQVVREDRTCSIAVRLPAGKSTLREYAETMAVALALALFVRTFVVQAFKIPSESMLPTLQVGDHILVNKLAYGFRLPVIGRRIVEFGDPRRGDIVVFLYPRDRSKDFIKRIVAVAGDRVELRDRHLYINGRPVADPHAQYVRGGVVLGRRDFSMGQVPPGHVFVMGDNRDRSSDSRFWGPVPVDDILGKAFLIYWSWDNRWRVRWGRIGERVR